MAARQTLHVALTEPLAQHVRAQVAAGRYVDAGAVPRDALRRLMARDTSVRGRIASPAEGRAPDHG